MTCSAREARLNAAGVALAVLLVLPSSSRAEQPAPAPPPEPAPEHSLTGNVGILSGYSFRGIAQTTGRPAVQGGFDYARTRGLYAGIWLSNISWLQDFGVSSRSSVEVDIYGGFKVPVGSDGVFVDLGTVYYAYPGTRDFGAPRTDTWEIYAGAGWNWVSAKYLVSLTDYFGARPTGGRTSGTRYLDVSATVPAGDSGLSLVAHVGRLDVANDGADDLEVGCTDWKLGASWTVPRGLFEGLELGAYYTGNNSDSGFYVDLTGYNTAGGTGVVYVKKTF